MKSLSNQQKAKVFLSMQVFLMLSILFAPFSIVGEYRQSGTSTLGFLVFAVSILFFSIALLKLGKSTTPSPIPKRDGYLVTTGIYKFARHPIYTALILGSLGWSLGFTSWKIFLLAIILTAVLFLKSKLEEEFLIEKFGKEYQSYMDSTGRFFPFMK